ncbi:hypothetical protein [Bdellovibrio svalbardensis]|uniref:Uncharacterized protein n=1 Tax=Bdellovibrio svalbardensis TaxID=2972972 RepID=A0ABT6DMS9_9BACT|nr:hypothetical protein [Bdellovibrio svalbardensis]MDG0817126.1 hypothetical protein [Bdellovibrio svalbardensis]
MKTLTFFLQIGILFAGALASAQGIESSMKGFNLQACSQDQQQCLVIKAEKTLGSQMKMLHALTKPEVTITSKKTAKTETLRGDTGYIDIEENQIVLYKKENGKLKETSINLSNFEKFSSEMGAKL